MYVLLCWQPALSRLLYLFPATNNYAPSRSWSVVRVINRSRLIVFMHATCCVVFYMFEKNMFACAVDLGLPTVRLHKEQC